MKKYLMMVMCMMLGAALFGCGKKSGLEGKVVDGKGKPMAGVKVVAKQVQPIKGYEQFESTTGTDGAFKFSKLFPTSAYELITYPDGANKNLSIKTESAPEGQTKILPEPVAISYLFSKDGITATDTKTDLMWAKNADLKGSPLTYLEAENYVRNLSLGGYQNWRIPTLGELNSMARYCGQLTANSGFDNVLTQNPYWSSNGTYSSGYEVLFMNGKVDHLAPQQSGYAYIWPVRNTN